MFLSFLFQLLNSPTLVRSARQLSRRLVRLHREISKMVQLASGRLGRAFAENCSGIGWLIAAAAETVKCNY